MLFGVAIILGAFYVRGDGERVVNGSVVVAPAPERVAITTKDSNGNGIEDWEENLQERFFETISIPTSTADSAGAGPYEPPTTLTGKFSEAFLEDYLEGKMQGADFSDPTALVGSAVKAIEKSSRSRVYTSSEIPGVVPASGATQFEYGNDLAQTLDRNAVASQSAMVLLQEALASNDATVLEEIQNNERAYAGIVKDLLNMSVPENFIAKHLMLLNAFSALRTDTEAMRQAFTDPLLALARIRQYETDMRSMGLAFRAIATALRTEGIIYTETDPGSYLEIFER